MDHYGAGPGVGHHYDIAIGETTWLANYENLLLSTNNQAKIPTSAATKAMPIATIIAPLILKLQTRYSKGALNVA